MKTVRPLRARTRSAITSASKPSGALARFRRPSAWAMRLGSYVVDRVLQSESLRGGPLEAGHVARGDRQVALEVPQPFQHWPFESLWRGLAGDPGVEVVIALG